MNTDFLSLKLTEKLINSRFSRTDFDENWKIIDEKMKELSETANVSFEPTDEELKILAAFIVFSREELEEIAVNIPLTDSELEKIARFFSEEQLDFLLEKFSLTRTQLEEIAGSLSQSQLQALASFFTLTEEQISQIIENFQVSDSELEKIATYFTDSQLNYMASKFNITSEQLETIAELFSEEQLRSIASFFTLTEEQITQIIENFQVSDSELEKIATYFTDSQLNYMVSKFNITSEQLETLAGFFSEEQLKSMASFFTLTEEQISQIVEEMTISEENLVQLSSLFTQDQLTQLANLIEFSEEQLKLLKGEPGEDAEAVEFTEEQEELIKLSIEGLLTKQDKLSSIESRATVIQDEDFIPITQVDKEDPDKKQTKLVEVMLVAEYIVSKSPIPQVGLTLDDYTKQELWAIFQFCQGQNYFEVGDRMTWISNRLVTTAQIADFNRDVKDLATGAKANVTFVLNDFVIADSSEIASVYMSEKSEWKVSDGSCLAPVIELQENGMIGQDIIPKDMVGLITTSKRYQGCGAWATLPISETAYDAYFFPLGWYDLYGTTSFVDQYTGESMTSHYPLFTSATTNTNLLYSTKIPTNGAVMLLRNYGTTAPSATALCCLTSVGGQGTVSSLGASGANLLTDLYIARQLVVGFCMG